jgi:hypothetical protein
MRGDTRVVVRRGRSRAAPIACQEQWKRLERECRIARRPAVHPTASPDTRGETGSHRGMADRSDRSKWSIFRPKDTRNTTPKATRRLTVVSPSVSLTRRSWVYRAKDAGNHHPRVGGSCPSGIAKSRRTPGFRHWNDGTRGAQPLLHVGDRERAHGIVPNESRRPWKRSAAGRRAGPAGQGVDQGLHGGDALTRGRGFPPVSKRGASLCP